MYKRWRIATLILGMAIAMSIFISACGSSTTTAGSSATPDSNGCVSGSITASGSTALQPFVQKVAEQYQSKCSGAKITVQPGGSKAGLSAVENGTVQIGDSDVPALSNQTDLVDHQVAIVIFTLIVNPDVTGVTNITTSNVQGIYTGKITNWNQLGGPNLPITVVSRPTTSGTRATFKKFMLNNANESPSQSKNLTVDSTGTVVQTVQQTNGAIGYVTLGGATAAGSSVVILKIDGQDASPANVQTNAYKFWNIEHMYTKGAPSGLTTAFLNYMVSSSAAPVASSLQFMQVSSVSQDIRATHNK